VTPATFRIGLLLLVTGLAIAAYLVNVPPLWITGVVLLLLVVLAILAHRQRKP
jgi:hypothetical protein